MTRFGLIIFLLSPLAAKSQSLSLCERSAQVLKILNENHAEPRKINETFLNDLNEEFFLLIDPRGLYFTQEDLKSDLIKITVSDLENKSDCNWSESITALYKKKLAEATQIISTQLAAPLLFSEDNFFSQNSFKQISFSKDQIELREKWRQWLSLEVLMTMYRSAQSDSSDFSSRQFLSFEKNARSKVRDQELKKIEALLDPAEGIESLINESLLNAVAKIFDPHSEYFSNAEMKTFENALSTTEPSFGFDLKENEWGEVSILRVMPGSPAWNSNEIHNGDILLQVRKPSGDFTDIDDISDPSELLKTWSENQIELKLKKADGKITIVKLIKEKIESAENRVQGFILKGKNKIGYVSLPSFYKQWNNENEGNDGCANDLAKEIIKLKKEGIEGLILDLRFNGGGSVVEAINVSGIFIDSGPVTIVKTKGLPLYSLKDSNRGSVYDGPLLVMVNGASASASEIVAATLQDYNRALIVGTPTYGKATGQRVLPTNSLNNEFVKVTIERLYRVTGKSNQNRGVIPDIKIPDLTETIVSKEKQAKHVLAADSVTKKLYYTPYPKPELDKIKIASKERISQNERFNLFDSVRQFYELPIPLKVDSFIKYVVRADHLTRSMSKLHLSPNFKVIHNQFDNSVLTMDSYRKSISDESLAQISNSAFIDEAYSILSDYINKTKN